MIVMEGLKRCQLDPPFEASSLLAFLYIHFYKENKVNMA